MNSQHKGSKMQHTNTNPLQTNEWSYTNNTDSAQNIIVTLNGGDGALSKSTWVESDWTKYWSAGARGVSVQCFINDTLQEVAQGGLGNPQSIADQKRWVRNESYKCGRYWYGAVKWCSRDVYDWSYTNRAFPRGGSGDTKSFAINLGAGEVLKIVFVGGSNIINTLFNGSVNLSFIPQVAPVIPEPEPEIPEVPEEQTPETELPEEQSSQPETPEVDSNENTEQENTENENTENENPPIVEPESPQEQEPTISVEMRAEARKLTEAMQSYQTFLNQNQATTITYNSHFLPQYNGTPIPYRLVIMGRYQMAYDEFVNTAMLSTIAYKQFWQELPTTPNNDYERDLKACGMLEPDSVIHKNLLELTYPQLLEIANGGKGDLSGESEQSPETQAPQTQEQKLARIQEIKQNALVSEFLSVKKTFTDYHNLIRQNQNPQNNATPTTPEQIQQAKNNQLIFDWFMSWLIDPTHTAELEDMPKSQSSTIQQGEAVVNQALAKWVLKIPNLNEIYADLQSKGMSYTLDEFKIMLVCFFDSVNAYKDSFENERNRYVEIYAMPEIRALIDELEKLEAEIA